jgi:hypothetical protein
MLACGEREGNGKEDIYPLGEREKMRGVFSSQSLENF